MIDPSSLMSALGAIWNEKMSLSLVAILLISAMLWRRCPDAHKTLRNTLYFLCLGFIGLLVTDVMVLSAGSGTPDGTPHGNAAIVRAGFILCIGAAVIRLLGLFVFRVVFAVLRIHPPSILEEIIVVIAYFVWAMLQVHGAGVPLGEIITTSALATAVLAFAMQDTLGNILGGLALQWDHSLKVGDWVRIGDVEGKIVDVKWRAISLETRNWETVVIPNSVMMKNQFKVLGERTNEPVEWRRWIWFSVDYSSPPDQIIKLAEQAVNDAGIALVARQPAPNCLLMDIEHSTARYALRYWLTDLAKDDPTDSMVRQHIYAAMNRRRIRPAMPRQHFYLTNKDESYQQHKHDVEISHVIELLSAIDLFQSFSAAELETLAQRVEYRPYAATDVIFRQGDVDPYLYIITAGSVSVYVDDGSGEESCAFSLQPGEIFGEIGLMTGEPRAATVRADTALECYALGQRDFTDILLSRDSIIHEISAVVVSRQSALQKARLMHAQHSENHKPVHSVHELVARVRKFLAIEQS
jgi:small-conductance mechanosensitive channel/CRP-like cAMP-binding protein